MVLLPSLSCSVLEKGSSDKPISIRLNQEQINTTKGIKLSRVQKHAEPYISLEIKDPKMVKELSQSNHLQIVVARGSRPINSMQTSYDIPYRMGFSIETLLDDAAVGDRIIFTVDDYVLYMLSIR